MHLLPLLLLKLLSRLKHLQVVFQLGELRIGLINTLLLQSAPFLTHRVSKRMLIKGDVMGDNRRGGRSRSDVVLFQKAAYLVHVLYLFLGQTARLNRTRHWAVSQ
jgi:hypothetical protein